MTGRTTRVRTATILALVCAVVIAGAGLFAWWNTDLLGRDDFCAGVVSADDAGAVLDGPGRLTLASAEPQKVSGDAYGFDCVVQRSSKLIGGDQASLTVDLTRPDATFPFRTRLWKNPAAMSYLADGAAGAVDDRRAWVMLPASCWDKIPSSGANASPVLELEVSNGTADRQALAVTAVHAARQIAGDVGCSAPELSRPVRLHGPAEKGGAGRTDTANACGLKGFRLPESTFFDGEATPGSERFTGTGASAWACTLDLDGPAEPQLTFALSQDRTLTKFAGRDPAVADRDGVALLECADGTAYVSMHRNDAYEDLLLDNKVPGDRWNDPFRAFIDAVAKKLDCGPAAGTSR
ncbi:MULTISPECIES: hypothetical protein [Streptomyces]|uniref:hypothetical protein n=1 Tax=Streptomyces TaxID=1883 RepID=UPI0029C300CB|nr:hypothetical protein [Streptomyces sp. ID01-9D]MDX5571155.1 hypothetical protein [Streptomyces sp. ID01-9D]